jgi:DNA-binding beta-propeller fold protein YncE
MTKYLSLILFSILCFAPKAHASYSYFRTITVTSTTSIASGTQTNFPMLVSSTLASWESSSTGGNVQNVCTAPNGGQEPCDLVFATSTNNCGTANLNFESERYVSSTGALIDWVNVPSESAGIIIYACYGNSGITTDQSHPSSTWDSNYVGLYHLPTTGTSTLNVNDSTANANNGTIHSATATSTIIDGGGNFVKASHQYIAIPTSTSNNLTTMGTLEVWVNLATLANYEVPLSNETLGTDRNGAGFYFGTNFFAFEIANSSTNKVVTGGTPTSTTWRFLTGTFNSSTVSLYLNGSVLATTPQTIDANSGVYPWNIGIDGGLYANGYFNGNIDEARISNVARSPSWILTEYNNESRPSTFYTVGGENLNPVPTTTSLSPTSTVVGGNDFTLTVNGTNFIASSSVLWNGSPRVTTFVSNFQVTATILGTDIASVGTSSVAVSNLAPGGGTSNAQTFTITNPIPTTTSLSPTFTVVGGNDFTLTVNGTNFIASSSVLWNGSPRVTTFVSSSSLTAVILAADIVAAGTSSVTVSNPGGGTSNAQTFTITNLIPTTTSLSPTSTAAGGGNFVFTVNGTNFIASSSVLWNGSARATTFVSSSSLTAIILGSDITATGTAAVAVSNPAPGGGTSNAQAFTITNSLPASAAPYNASGLLGQANYSNNGVASQGIYNEGSAVIDPINHRLFVADTYNSRVLVFPVGSNDNIVTQTASYVLGQPNFTSSTVATTQNGMDQPYGLGYDQDNSRLFVADEGNNRVLVFNVATSSIANGENASYVLGQADFTSNTATTSQSSLWTAASDMAYDATNARLFVPDIFNNRVLVFNVATSSIANGENASYVLGQADFTSNTAATTQSRMFDPQGAAFDADNNRLFVSDVNNSRVTVFNVATSSIANGENASYVLGQPNFTTRTRNTTQNGMNIPNGVAYDPTAARLFVSEYDNSRVTVFNVATSTIANGENASYVLGQPNFTSSAAATTQGGLNQPFGISYDASNTLLFVADSRYSRVMVFGVATSTIANGENATMELGHTDTNGNYFYTSGEPYNDPTPSAFALPADVVLDTANHRLFVGNGSVFQGNGNREAVFTLDANNHLTTTSASYVLGQPDFYTDIATTTQSGLNAAAHSAYDPINQRLFVVDQFNNRVLVFNVATSTIANGENASYVLGQPNFTTSTAATTQSGLNTPYGLAYDATNARLFVGDQANKRVLVFNVATSTIANGENASCVLGENNFTSNNATTSQMGITKPYGLEFDGVNNRLFINDGGSNRVLVFNVATSTIANGENASYVLGQPNFTTSTAATTQSGLKLPTAATYDASYSRLFVSDSSNSRIMIFGVATSTIANGENALNVLGQSTFTSSTAVTSQSGFVGRTPPTVVGITGLAYDSTNHQLFVADTNGSRIMIFTFITITTPSLSPGAEDAPYSATITTTSTQGTINFALYNSSLPPGLFLNSSTGVISGTPTASGTYPFTVEADDTFTTGNFFDRATYTLTITNPLAATPTFSPGAGTYTSTQSVTISCTTPSSTLYYTDDGSTPTASSTPYTTPVSVAASETLNAICAASGYQNSAVGSAVYVIQASGGGGGVTVSGGGGPSYSIAIDGGAPSTATTSATLSFYATGAYTMELSNTADFASATWEPYATTHPWILTGGAGTKTIYARFRSVNGSDLGTVSASIELLGGTATSSTTLALQAQIAALQAELQSLLARVNGNNSGTGTGFSSSYVFTRNLGLWDTGADVQTLQALLINHHAGPAAQTLAAHGTTKFFGVFTYRALKEFQKSVGIPATGYFGPLTRAYLSTHP